MKPLYWSKGISYLSKKDPFLKVIFKLYKEEYLSINKNYFHCLINSIIGQQISIKAAGSIRKRFYRLKKNITPITVLNIKQKQLMIIGLSKQKITYIKNISQFFIENKNYIKQIVNHSNEDIEEKLISIKGVGQWTVNMFLIFGLGRSNVLPKKDLGLLKAISLTYKINLPIGDKDLEELFKRWMPYNTVATWYLWRSLDPIPVIY